jgi:hypothetical protein
LNYTSKSEVSVTTHVRVAKFYEGRYTGLESVELKATGAATDFFSPHRIFSKKVPDKNNAKIK